MAYCKIAKSAATPLVLYKFCISFSHNNIGNDKVKCGKEVKNSNLLSPSRNLVPIAKTIPLKRDAMRVCIIYQAKPN